METAHAVFGVENSLSGKAWRWRGGNMALEGGAAGLQHDLVDQLLLGRGIAREEERLRARAEDVLDFLTLTHLRDERAGTLSGGQKKLLELGRTMMVDARIVFLDEVGAGVNRTLLKTIGEAIVRLNKERGYTFCVIEHDMDFIARLCDSVIVMAEGKVLASGAHIGKIAIMHS